VSVIRESVAAVYEAEESWTQAAQVLAGIDLDSGQRQLDAAYKLQKCIKIAQLFLVRARQRRR
jgi:COP9 signalosome complex subunit 4